MTDKEISIRYKIPFKLINKYKSFRNYDVTDEHKNTQLNDSDIENLGCIMALLDIGFTVNEALEYVCISYSDNERLKIISKKRDKALREIHTLEKQIECLDYLRYKIRHYI